MTGQELIRIGEIVGIHGLRGILKVYSHTEDLTYFKPDNQILVQTIEETLKTMRIMSAGKHKRVLRMQLEGIHTAEAAQAMVGYALYIKRDQLPEPEEGVYYWADLIGLSVLTVKGDYIGRLEHIISTGSNDVYVVKHPEVADQTETLVPAIDSVVREIDLENKVMRVLLPEGL